MAKHKEIRKSPFASNIREFRKKLGLNQEGLAHKIGVHLNTIKDMERGLSEGQPDTRAALADFFKCEVWELFKDKESEIVKNTTSKADLALELIAQIPKMSEATLKKMLNMVLPNENLHMLMAFDLDDESKFFTDEKDQAKSTLSKEEEKAIFALRRLKHPEIFKTLALDAEISPRLLIAGLGLLSTWPHQQEALNEIDQEQVSQKHHEEKLLDPSRKAKKSAL